MNGTTDAATFRSKMLAFEEVLACNIKDVVSDLCMADAGIIMAYAANQQHGNMREIITASAELYFKDNTLTYADGVEVSMEWGHPPSVALDMEFVHGPVSVFFKLVLGGRYVGVQIDRLLLNEHLSSTDFNIAEFDQALASARLQPVPPRFEPAHRPRGTSWH